MREREPNKDTGVRESAYQSELNSKSQQCVNCRVKTQICHLCTLNTVYIICSYRCLVPMVGDGVGFSSHCREMRGA